MPILTDAQPILTDAQRATVVALEAQHDTGALTPEAAADVLNTPSVPNPVPQPQVPRPFIASDIEVMLSPESLGKFFGLPMSGRIVDALDRGDATAATKYADALAAPASPVITTAERDAILARVAETIPDPAWVPKFSPWRVAFGDTPFVEARPAEEYDPIRKEVVPVVKEVTCTGHCTPAVVAEARGGS